jgi:hypothetical protein
MARRFLAVFGLVVLLVFLGLAGLLATSEAMQTGSAAGIRYNLAHTGFQGYSFAPSPMGFRYEQRTWFGFGGPGLEVTVANGRVLIDRLDCGPIRPGEQLTVTSDRRVLINNRELAP